MTMKKRVNFVDIDGTLMKSYFEKYYIERPDLLMKMLASGVPFPWVAESDVFDDGAIIHFISGRFDHQSNVTMDWIKRNFGIGNFELHVVGFTSYENYIKDKAKMLIRILGKIIDQFGDGIEMHLYEDSEKVIEETIVEKNAFCSIPMEIHLVKDGILQPSYVA